VNLPGTKLTPLGESSGSFEFEVWSGVEVAFLIEVIMERRMDGDEFLQGP